MNETLTLINACIFFTLGAIHLYWLLGGRWALNAAVPTNRNGNKVFNPGPLPTFIVTAGLTAFALINLMVGEYIDRLFPFDILQYILFGIACVFFLRVIGDFKYIGLFKRYSDSGFAKRDTWLYIPISFWMALSHGLLFI